MGFYKKKEKLILLLNELSHLQAERKKKMDQIYKLRQKSFVVISKLVHWTQKIKSVMSKTKAKLESLCECMLTYEQMLDVRFIQGEQDELQVLFKNINPFEPEQVFIFAMRIGEKNEYVVTKLSPEVDGWQNDLYELNKNPSKFSMFIKKMRKLFHNSIIKTKII